MDEAHRKLSVQCFNECWMLLDKPARTAADVEDRVLLAAVSLWHWKQRRDCTPTNVSIGLWQVARALALAGSADLAAAFGERCLRVSLEAGLAPFYVGYAHEALCRAAVVREDDVAAAAHLARARGELDRVQDPEERGLLGPDLAALAARLGEGDPNA